MPSGAVPGLGRVVMVVPTYNEALNLEPLVARLRDLQPEVEVERARSMLLDHETHRRKLYPPA